MAKDNTAGLTKDILLGRSSGCYLSVNDPFYYSELGPFVDTAVPSQQP